MKLLMYVVNHVILFRVIHTVVLSTPWAHTSRPSIKSIYSQKSIWLDFMKSQQTSSNLHQPDQAVSKDMHNFAIIQIIIFVLV